MARQECAGVVDVRDLGAAADGSTDDTSAVQAAIDRGGVTFFPPGDYSCRTLTLRKASHLRGANSGTYTYHRGAYRDDYARGSVSRIVRRDATNAPLLIGPIGAKRVIIEDLQLDGNNPGQTDGAAHVVALPDSPEPEDTQWLILRCYVHGRTDPRAEHWGHGGSNIYVGGGRMAVHLAHTVSTYAHHHGLEINGADAVVDSCILGDNGAHGLVISGWSTTVTTCSIFNNTNGIHIPGTGAGSPRRVLISASTIDRNRRHGILIDRGDGSGAAGVSITGSGFTSNSTDGDGVGAHVAVEATTGQVALGANVFSLLEPGYTHRTAAAVQLGPGATVLDLGNLYAGDSVEGFTNAPPALRRSG